MSENTELWTMGLLDRIKVKYNLESVDSIPDFVDNLDRELSYVRTLLGRLQNKYSRLEIEAAVLEELVVDLTTGLVEDSMDIHRLTGLPQEKCSEMFDKIKKIWEK